MKVGDVTKGPEGQDIRVTEVQEWHRRLNGPENEEVRTIFAKPLVPEDTGLYIWYETRQKSPKIAPETP